MIVPRETADDAQLTAERVKRYIDAADNELGHWCCEPWVEKCRAILRAALSGRATIPSDADERALPDSIAQISLDIEPNRSGAGGGGTSAHAGRIVPVKWEGGNDGA